MSKYSFAKLLAEAKQNECYWTDRAKTQFTEDLCALMEKRGVSRSDLASRVGVKPAYVTKVLRGDTNFTIESMVKLVRALEGRLDVHVGPQEVKGRWEDIVVGQSFSNSDRFTPSKVIHTHQKMVAAQNTNMEMVNEFSFAA